MGSEDGFPRGGGGTLGEAVLPAHVRGVRPQRPRSHARFSIRVHALVGSEERGSVRPARDLDAHVANVSEGGLFIQTTDLVPVGTRVQVVLSPDTDDAVTVTGRVVWASPERGGQGPGMGVALDGDQDVVGRLLSLR